MWTPLSASRWILLLTLGVVMLLSESGANEHDCCFVPPPKGKTKAIENIEKCWKQTKSIQCDQEAYWVKPKDASWTCVHPKRKWLQDLIKQGKIECPDNIATVPIFEVVDEDEDKDEDEDEDEEEEWEE